MIYPVDSAIHFFNKPDGFINLGEQKNGFKQTFMSLIMAKVLKSGSFITLPCRQTCTQNMYFYVYIKIWKAVRHMQSFKFILNILIFIIYLQCIYS